LVAQELEEIKVTAQKREQNIQDVPIAITAFTGEQIELSGIQDAQDLTQLVPNFQLNASGGYAQPFIRGVGSQIPGGATYASVATYIDGVYLPRTHSLAYAAGELDYAESVQVLRGPQGTLYGRNATGGALVIDTPTPSPGDEFNGRAQLSFGNYDNLNGVARFSGGMGDTFAFSVFAALRNRDGYIENLGEANFDDQDDVNSSSINVKLVFQPNDRLEIIGSAWFHDAKERMLSFRQVADNQYPGLIPGLNSPQTFYAGVLLSLGLPPELAIPAAANVTFAQDHWATYDNQWSGYKNGLLKGSYFSDDGSGAYISDTILSLTVNYEFEKMNLTAITGYNDSSNRSSAEVFRADPSTTFPLSLLGLPPSFDTPNVGFSGNLKSKMFTQEVYLVSTDSKIDWIAGVYYFDEHGPNQITGDFFSTSSWVADNDWKVRSIAAYGEITVPFNENWFGTLGGRYTDEKQELDDYIDPSNPLTQPGQINVGFIEQKNSKFTWNAKLAYQADNWMAYFSAGTGFKSGSLNANNAPAGTVDPEENTAFEVGFKSDLLENRLRFNAAAFYYNYDNLQLNVLEPGSGATYLVDGVSADVSGLEFDILGVASDSLTLFLNVGFMFDREYTSDATLNPIGGPTTVLPIEGNKMVMTSDSTIAAGFNWTMPFVTNGSLALNANLRYDSGFWIDQSNNYGSGGGLSDASYTTVNASLSYTSANDNWMIWLWANNIFDEKYFRGGIDAAGGLTQMANSGNPANYGISAEVRF